MKKFFYLLFFPTFIFLFTACEKFLDIKPKQILINDKAITSVRDLEAVAAGMYDGLQSENVLSGNQIVFSEFLAEETQVQEYKLSTFGTSEIYSHATTVQIGLLRSMWAENYAVINRANNVIAAIDGGKLSGKDFDLVKDKLKGEAFFVRAIVLFHLLEFWSLPYDLNGGNSQLGVVIRTEPTLTPENLAKARSSVEECYAQIISDLQVAENYLSKAGVKKSADRASEMAAAALLARVSFLKGDYANASLKANKVIASTLFSLEQSAIAAFQATGNSASKETIFQLVNISTDQSNSLPGNFQQNPIFRADTSVLNKYDANDTRKSLINTFAGLNYIKKFNKIGTLLPNTVLIRFAEMHLIRAEANLLANGDTTAALMSYNEIMKRAMQNNYVEETAAVGLLAKVQLQRQLELYCEGDRYLNLRRLKQNVRFGKSYNDPSLLFKIPQEEMSGNTLIEQNP